MSKNSMYPGDTGFSYKPGTPASFADYLKAYGTDSNKNFEAAMRAASQTYGQSVKEANDAYYRSLMTYGQKAEALAGSGLVGTGVSDYGSHVAYAARQGSVATAGAANQLAAAAATATKKAEDQANAGSYAGYLSGYYRGEREREEELKNNRSGTLLDIYNSGETDASQISLLLTNSGYFSAEEIPALAEQYANANRTRTTSEAAESMHTYIVKNKIYDEATIRSYYGTIAGLTEEEINAYVAKSVEATAQYGVEAKEKEQEAIDQGKDKARISVATAVQRNSIYTLEGIETAFKDTGKFTDEESAEEAKKLYDSLNQGDALAQLAAGYYSDILNATGSETMAKAETEKKFGSDGLAKGMAYVHNITISDFETELKRLGENSAAVFSYTDEEGNTVNVSAMDKLNAYKNAGYFDDEGGEERYNAVKGQIQSINDAYVTNAFKKLFDGTYQGDDEQLVQERNQACKDILNMLEKSEISIDCARSNLLTYYIENVSAAKEAGDDMKLRTLCEALVQAKRDDEEIQRKTGVKTGMYDEMIKYAKGLIRSRKNTVYGGVDINFAGETTAAITIIERDGQYHFKFFMGEDDGATVYSEDANDFMNLANKDAPPTFFDSVMESVNGVLNDFKTTFDVETSYTQDELRVLKDLI